MTQPRPDEFKPPQECPVFEPSWEEFSDPFAYINKIRPIAEKTGICKVRPPPDWQPPFACDVDRLHFTPRIQRLNELEAQTRVKLNFLDQIAKFWELQGCSLKIPHVERKILDLYQLNKNVADEGGFDIVCRDRRWTAIALKMGFAPGKAVGSHLRSHYERLLYPYNLFQSGANLLVSWTDAPTPIIFQSFRYEHNHYFFTFHSTVSDQQNKVDLYMCLVCGSGSDEDRLLLCDGCDASYHTFCLIPPLHDIPKGDWRCPKCLAQECSKPQEAFGFEQAYRDYSLRAFGEMADSFKSDYFNMPVHMVPTELVEKEFWRLVSTIEEDVTVEYGADIASKEFGSGFPIRNGRFKVSEKDEKYLKCGWNLNNMAMMDPSVLTHVTADICGMTLPWLYVGMCFSSFCWHIEDHWSYSINYLHWGEPKTWYGAPGFAAEQLEAVMKKLAPELFQIQPDLLHQLVTIMNPNTLMSYGVPIYRTNQCAGEFVITFPRAYHSGFNQGFNFAEAVNFFDCLLIYLDVVLASAVQKDMKDMIREEQDLRDKVRKMGVLHCEQAEYDLLQDDERQCAKCRTTCFLSAITCPCSPGQLVCLHHVQDLCSCPLTNYTLNYRFTLDDLYPMMNVVKQRAESYDEWASRVTETLEAKLDKKKSERQIQLLIDMQSKMLPDNDLLRQLRLVTQDAEKCFSVAQQLLNGKRQTRYRCGGGKTQSQLTVQELRSFVRQLYNVPCSLPQAPKLKDLLNCIEDFQQHSEKVLMDEATGTAVIQSLLDVSFDFDVELPEIPILRERLEQARWLEGVQQTSAQPSTLTLETMRRLIDQGVGLTPHPSVEKAMARLQELLTVSEHWEEKTSILLKARPPPSIEVLSEAAEKVVGIPAYLPNCMMLKDSISRAREWLQEAEAFQDGDSIPLFDNLSDMVLRGQAIPVQLDPLNHLESLVTELQAWKESAAKTFLMKNSHFTLLEVLCPRFEVGAGSPKRKSKKAKDCSKKKMLKLDSLSDVEKALLETKDTTSAVRLREMWALSSLRAANESKLLPTADCMDLKVCVCQNPPMGAMLQCELCRDAFHSVCVRAPSDSRSTQAWLCPDCRRSEKPPLDKVLPLLASLQRIQVRLPEGDALHYLVERTVSWQHRARQVSASCGLPDLEESFRSSPSPVGKVSHTPSLKCKIQFTYFKMLCFLSLQDGLKKEVVNGAEKKAKRRLEREALETERRDKAKKLQNKRQKMNKEKNLERRAASTSSSPRSDFSQSDDSEEEMAMCPAEGCQQPEGDEVDWVQCDGSCNQWFHQVCVGVTAELAEKEDYVCVSCTISDGPDRRNWIDCCIHYTVPLESIQTP
uniref:[histone H3]-trimethyl-L-lysine(4) demethylase n=1 Tax=Hucho hucho TaxID=62062 RepID=A0A4W5NLZ4_9TELE